MLFANSVPAVLRSKLERTQQDLPSASLNAVTAKPRRLCTLRSTGSSAHQNCALHPWGSGSKTSTLDTSSNAGFHINDSSTPQLQHLVVPSQAALGSSRQEQQQQQQQRPERLPRCSTVSLQTELATPALVVFSGGTAFNSVAGHLRKLTTQVSHVLPVSDDGGSTAEIVRVIGGPAVGDIRSRCLRLADDRDEEARAVRRLLAHRLPGSSSQEAKMEWYSIVEGTHSLWGGVSEPYKHMIRAFLVHFQLQILSQVSQGEFNFMNGSIGNFFFAGARTFFRSLESAVFLFSRVSRIPHGSTVLPAICTEEVITLGAELEDGTVIRGQNNISHPTSCSDSGGAGPTAVDKSVCDPLPSPVRRVFYLSREGTGQEHEVSPPPNPRVLHAIQGCDAVVYGMGSLYTSICPTLILEGVGEAIAARDVHKVLLLNGSHDRETSTCGSHSDAMRASDVVMAVTDALNRRRSRPVNTQQPESKRVPPLKHPPASYITTLITPKGGAMEIDRGALEVLGVTRVVEVAATVDVEGKVLYDPEELVLAIGQLLLGQPQPSTPAAAAAAGVSGPYQ